MVSLLDGRYMEDAEGECVYEISMSLGVAQRDSEKYGARRDALLEEQR